MLTTQQMIDQEGYKLYRFRNQDTQVLARRDTEQDTVWLAPLWPNQDGKFGASEFWATTTLINDIWDAYRDHEYSIEIDNVDAFDNWFEEAAE